MGAMRKLGRHKVGHRKSARVERIPFGYSRKMSDVIVELAEPLLKDDMDPEQFHLAITIAATCWNLSLAPANERPALIEDMMRVSAKAGASMDEMRQIAEKLIARKEALFPNDRRLITDYQVSGTLDDGDIVVEYSPPEE